MKELKNFQKNNKNSFDQNCNNEQKIPKELDEALNRYKGLDEDALIEKLLQNVARQKELGVFDKEQLRRFVDTMGNMITSAQKEKLENLIKVIDEQVDSE